MKITLDIDTKSVENIVKNFNEKQKEVIVRRLERIGEKCTNIARNLPSPTAEAAIEYVEGKRGKKIKKYRKHQPTYIDRTGNLRHSISYLVALDGEIKIADLRTNKIEESPRKNLTKEATDKILTSSEKGIILIMVAGMDYAKYVSLKGYDVLDSAVIAMKEEFQKLVDLLNKV